MRLIVADPGHFHATLLQKDMYASLDSRVAVYAPLGRDVLDYLARIALFNSRPENPTHWDLDVHLSAHPMAELLRDRAGEIVVFTGKNRGKIDRIVSALEAGLHVLADKPWIITSSDMPKLERALSLAEQKNIAAYDIMTERYEVTSQLQREFVNDSAVFGALEKGSASEPAVQARSVHNLIKVVAGVPLRRPSWFFDTPVYGEGLADVGTHVVDLVQWTAYADQAIDYRTEIDVIEGRRWPLTLSPEQFAQVTGERRDAPLDYYCNNSVYYTLRGVHVKLEIVWQWQAERGAGDVYEAAFRGSRASVEIRQGETERHLPELYIVPRSGLRDQVFAATRRRIAALQSRWPGLDAVEAGGALRLTIPEQFRVGHEAHFGQVATRFFDYVRSPESMPAWERPNMLAKYYVSTKGVDLGVNGES
ncbi:MAG: putative oxidoreductase C-terminal domain-containing protein [Bryobacteraceae bacterium]|jgi:predicted dehydrogenase